MNNKSLKAAIILTYIFMAILVVLVIALPMLVTWYVEIRGKSASLPTTMMVTCYPCAPFTGISLFCLKKLLKNAINDELFSLSSIRCLRCNNCYYPYCWKILSAFLYCWRNLCFFGAFGFQFYGGSSESRGIINCI